MEGAQGSGDDVAGRGSRNKTSGAGVPLTSRVGAAPGILHRWKHGLGVLRTAVEGRSYWKEGRGLHLGGGSWPDPHAVREQRDGVWVKTKEPGDTPRSSLRPSRWTLLHG